MLSIILIKFEISVSPIKLQWGQYTALIVFKYYLSPFITHMMIFGGHKSEKNIKELSCKDCERKSITVEVKKDAHKNKKNRRRGVG